MADEVTVAVVRLPEHEAWARLAADGHGVLATLHPERGVDAVPAVYAVIGDHLGIPVDTVKPKSSTRLERERNLERDPRATLLVEHWDRHDWDRLWWVRAELRHEPAAVEEASGLADALEATFPQYAGQPFARLLVFRVMRVTGWAASAI